MFSFVVVHLFLPQQKTTSCTDLIRFNFLFSIRASKDAHMSIFKTYEIAMELLTIYVFSIRYTNHVTRESQGKRRFPSNVYHFCGCGCGCHTQDIM